MCQLNNIKIKSFIFSLLLIVIVPNVLLGSGLNTKDHNFYLYESKRNDMIPEDAVRDDIAINKTIESKYITTKDGKDYIIDTNGFEQEILTNVDDAAVGEVIYYGKYDGERIPYLVTNKENGEMTVVSIPKFNFAREEAEYDTSKYWDNFYEEIAFLNSEFIDKLFNNNEQEKIVEKVYREMYTHFDNIKKFNVKYKKEDPSKKFGASFITMKIFEQFDFGNLYYDIGVDHTKQPLDFDKTMNYRNAVCYLKVKNEPLNKEVNYYDVDIKFDLGIEKYTNYKRFAIILKYEDNKTYLDKINGFKELDDGFYYFENSKKLVNAIRSKDGEDYYLNDDGMAHNLKDFKIEKISGIPVLINGDMIARNIIIENGKKYVDFNGIVHDLHTEYDDFKNAKVSDSLLFGHEKDNEDKKLVWRVVNIESGVITAIMEDTIKFWGYFGTSSSNVANLQVRSNDCFGTWEDSDRRKYLNEYFYNECFSDFEKGKIIANNITADAFYNSDNFSGTGHDTLDKVFFYDRNSYDYMNTYEEEGKKLLKAKPNIYNKTIIEKDLFGGHEEEVKKYNFKLSENSFKFVRPWILINTMGDVPIINTKNTNEDYNFVASVSNAKTSSELVSVRDYKALSLGHFQKADDESWYKKRGEKSVEINRRVRWHILGVTDDTVYYISQNTIDVHPIKEGALSGISGFFARLLGKTDGNKWSESYIRRWLNNEFMNSLFDSSEKNYLTKTKKKHTYVDKDGKLQTEECEDFITLLSYDEYNLYDNAVSSGATTAFAESKINDKRISNTWALSTMDSKTGYFYTVNKQNNKIELLKTDRIAIRPCIAVKRNKLNIKNNIPEKKKTKVESHDIKYQYIFKDKLFADTINFGSYDINGNGKEDLEWQIVTRKQKYALLISKDILFYENFIGKYGIPSWNKSDLRNKLNTSFYNEAFTEEEKKKILPIKNYSKYNIVKVGDINEDDEAEMDKWDKVLEDETIDRLFIPKKNDFIVRNQYFSDEMEILSVEAPLNNLNMNMPKGEEGVYWLREGDINGFYAIDKNGYVAKEEDRKMKSYGVRPMMWVDMGDVK